MLPLKLVIEAFGPYRERQVVDFTRFADKFLIWGETGAGKTVLLDAMTAALYNHTSAEERGDTEAMRCQMADNAQDTCIEFTFSVRGRVYRFWKRLRPVRRRKADAEEKYKMECGALEVLQDGSEKNLMQSDKAREQETLAEKIIGMGYQQFVQVMVLPQGKFERFLTADSSEKEKILRNIFRTDRFNKYQESLNKRFRALDAEVRQMEGALTAQLALYDAENTEALALQIAQDQTELEALRKTVAARKEEYEKRNEQAAAVQQLEEKFLRLQRSRENLRLLTDKGEKIAQQERTVARAEQARNVLPAAAERDRVRRADDEAETELVQAQSRLERAQSERTAAAEALQACVQEREKTEALRAELSQAERRLPELAELDQALRREAAARRELEPAEQRSETLEIRLKQTKESESRLNEQIRSLESSAGKLSEAQSLCEAYAQAGKCARQVSQLEKQLAAAQTAQDAARKALADTNERANQAMRDEAERQNQYFSNAAAELSKRLEEGKPCPVCGSIHHPNVHQSRAYDDARNQYLRARELYRRVHEELTQAAAQCEGAQERVRSLEEQLAAARAEAAAGIAYDERKEQLAKERLHALQTDAERCSAQKKELERCVRTRVQLEQEQKSLQEDLAEKRAQLFAAQAIVRSTRQRVGESAQTASELQSRILELKNDIARKEEREKKAIAHDHEADTQLKLCQSARQDAAEREALLKKQLGTAQSGLERLLKTCGFEEETEFRSALLEQEQIERLRAQVQEYRQNLAAARAEEAAAGKGVEGSERPDVEAALRLRQEAQQQWNDVLAAEGTLAALVEGKEKMLARVQRDGGKVEQMRVTRDKMRAFTESFTYAKGVTLSSFVLSAMLGTVTEQANQLLMLVHGGRYRLSIKKASTRAKLDGLELEVFDAYTGQERDVRTLSGGEKFLVSLSLSLGLSAVVRAQAGGISMEAMFIDEGFGTLDPRSIKDALDVLTRIGSGSRVGIISHVDVLRENILQGIEVIKSEKGSRVQIRT